MWGIKCCNCEEYRNEWCEKVYYSPFPHIIRDCQYFRRKGMPDFDTEQEAVEASPWHDPEKELPEAGVEVLVKATTEHAKLTQLLAIYDPNEGWFLTDVDYDLFSVKAWMEIPEWKGGGNE